MDKDESMINLKLYARPKTSNSRIKQAKLMISELEFHDLMVIIEKRENDEANCRLFAAETKRKATVRKYNRLEQCLIAENKKREGVESHLAKEEEEISKVRSALARLQEEHLQVTSILTAKLTSSQEELEAERRLWNKEKLELQGSLRDATQAVDEEKEEILKVRSALAQAVKAKEQSQSQWEREVSRLLEEILQVTFSLTAGRTRSQEELEAERSLWNQENLELQESLRAATQAVDEKEIPKVRSALAQAVKDTEQPQSQWERDVSQLLEEILQVTFSLTAGRTRSQEELEAERSLWNQEKLELQESLRAATQAVDEEEIPKVRSALAQAVKDTEQPQSQWERDVSQLLEEILQVTFSLTAELTRSQEELEAERSLCYQEKLEFQESLRAAIQAVDEEEEETSKVRSALARLQEEHLQVTSSLTVELTSSQEELEAERSLWNQEKLELQESLRAAKQAVDEETEAGKKSKKKSVFKRFRKFLCCSGTS
ncbi:unnamed protein product [Pleuronectes platessa]|uniref:Uncharacterized protein n=1 Tax=Pleuronectes platessa TaxID=8262 RepID=A0A9N7W176_PLEPL|nr:unnamed protein product [Pleuronectes platessa]